MNDNEGIGEDTNVSNRRLNFAAMRDSQKDELANNDFEIVENSADDEIEKCIDCPLNRVCEKAYLGCVTKKEMKSCECWYEKNGRWQEKRALFNRWQAFVDVEPKYFMEKMMQNYHTLEQEAVSDYSFAKGMQLQYLLMSIYKMKFGEKRQIENNSSNVTVDIQRLLDSKRE